MAPAVGYVVEDAPAVGLGAFCPTMAVIPLHSSWGKVHVVGAPGTMAIPSPEPDLPPAAGPKVRGGANAPNVFFPSIYYVDEPQERAPVTIRNHNPLPMPATAYNVRRVAMPEKPNQGRRRIGSVVAMRWPRVFARFPTLGQQ